MSNKCFLSRSHLQQCILWILCNNITFYAGDDEIVTKIPNTQLADIRVSNLSSLKISQVKQTLHFAYNYLNDIPELVNDITSEITNSCDKVITDGSRSFRVTWVGYTPAGLEVVVNCKLKVPPKSGAYHAARQEVMEAIARVVKRKGVEFAPPTEVKLVGSDSPLPQMND